MTHGVIPPSQLLAAKRRAWQLGAVDYLFDDAQCRIDIAFESSPERRHYLLCSRRLGKSYYCFAKAVQVALQKPNARVLYLAPFAKNADEIAYDTSSQVFIDCPPALKPEYRVQAKEFLFPNGSIIRLRGTNGEHAQYLRGGTYDLVILDEAGTMDDLRHVLYDVCEPTTVTTRGRILIATTPPRTPGHESATIFEAYAGKGAVSVYTIRDADAGRFPHEERLRALANAGERVERIADILAGAAEAETTTALREYFCRFITDAELAVLPEFDVQARAAIVLASPRPKFYDAYVSCDPGQKDRTGIIYGHWDFLHSKLVIEDEDLMAHPNTPAIANAIKTKESTLWGYQKPRKRISDVDLLLINDLRSVHGLEFVRANKPDSDGAIHLLRAMIHNRELVIHPRCQHLIRQMQNVTWNSKATDFQRAGDGNIDGHYDLVAALKYLARGIDRHHNPWPANWWMPAADGIRPDRTWVSPRRKATRGLNFHDDTPAGRRLARRR